jgi:hypothetical protein
MNLEDPQFVDFLLRAKKSTYAAGDAGKVEPSRANSHDLTYREGDWSYLDTYLGGSAFIGEEAVWYKRQPEWGMNYYGTMTIKGIPEGFSDFLKLALRNVLPEAPYRGPELFKEGGFAYSCHWEGTPALFHGNETISLDGQVIYTLAFHGGKIIE